MEYEPVIKLIYVENDTLPEILCEYKYKDLSGYDIELHIHYDNTPLIKKAITLNLSNGRFKFKFDSSELKYGYYKGEIQFINPNRDIHTIQGLIFDIRREYE